MRIIFSLFLGYILAAPLTDKISLDLRLTEWGNLLTYVWWLTSGLVWTLASFGIILAFAALVAMFERRK